MDFNSISQEVNLLGINLKVLLAFIKYNENEICVCVYIMEEKMDEIREILTAHYITC